MIGFITVTSTAICLDMKGRNEVADILRSFYLDKSTVNPGAPVAPFRPKSIHNDAPGLGDSIIMTSVVPEIKVFSQVLAEITETRFSHQALSSEPGLAISELAQHDWLGGHAIQRFQRSLGLTVNVKPTGKLGYDPSLTRPNRVFVHLQNGTDWKRAIPNSLSVTESSFIQEFFSANPQFEPYFYNNDLAINELISQIESCEYFLGIDSGPMHIAAALNRKSIILINDPACLVYLPKIKECELPNLEWLYPQNVHLNRAGETALVPRLTFDSLLEAFAGQVYPYWSDEYLDIGLEP
jgi:hypothetical protein